MANYAEIMADYTYQVNSKAFANLCGLVGEVVRVNFTEQGENKDKVGTLASVDPFNSITFSDGDVLYFVNRNHIIRSISDKNGKVFYDKTAEVPKYAILRTDISQVKLVILGQPLLRSVCEGKRSPTR